MFHCPVGCYTIWLHRKVCRTRGGFILVFRRLYPGYQILLFPSPLILFITLAPSTQAIAMSQAPNDGKGGTDIFVDWYTNLVVPLLVRSSVFSVLDADLDYQPIDEPSDGSNYPKNSRITPVSNYMAMNHILDNCPPAISALIDARTNNALHSAGLGPGILLKTIHSKRCKPLLRLI